MGIQDKYQKVLDYARQNGVDNLNVREQNNVLYVDGTAPNEDVKKQIWHLYEEVDPEMRSADMVLNVDISANPTTQREYEVRSGDSLSKIAQDYEGISWQEIFEANRDLLDDPDKIFPGQKLKIPQK